MNVFGVTVDEPVWLWLTALALPLSVVAMLLFSAMSKIRLATAVVLRTVLLALAGLMLAGAASVREVDRIAVVAVVDVSDSALRYGLFGNDEAGRPIGPAAFAMRYLEAASERQGPDDLVGVVAFDGAVRAVALPRKSGVLDRPVAGQGVDGSALAAAIEQAAALIPPDATGRIVLFSDGNATSGDVDDVAGRLAGGVRPVAVNVVPFAMRRGGEVVVESLDAPSNADPDSTITLRVQLRATAPASGTLRVTAEGRPVDINGERGGNGRRVTLAPGRRVELVDVPIGDARVHRFDVTFEPDEASGGDIDTANNRAEAFTLARGPGRVLLVDGVGASASDALLLALGLGGVMVDRVPPGLAPDDLLSLQRYDLVVMSNVPADAVTPATEAALDGYVRELGGGLLFIGGAEAFGAGGWRGSTLEALMPVKLDLPEKLIVPEAAIVLVLDNSGSMAQSVMGSAQTQQAIANESAARAIATLDKTDYIGVIAFNSDASLIHALSPNDAPSRLAGRVRSIGSGGGTNITPALRLAQQQLREVDAKVKHVIVLTDGQSESAEDLPGVVTELRDEGVRVSTIGIGDGADTATLEAMAAAGDGTAYHVVNPRVLPRVFLKAIRVIRTPMVREVPFEPVLLPVASPLLRDVASPPILLGLTLTQARDEPDVVNAIVTPGGEPVLAHWRVGLGQVGAFTSDAHNWARRWVPWTGFDAFWAGVRSGLARASDGSGGELRVEHDGDRLRLRYDAFDEAGRPIERLAVPASIYRPDGTRDTVRLRQTAPGVYETEIEAASSGNHIVIATPTLDGAPLTAAVGGSTVRLGAEFDRLEPDLPLLRRIAEVTGGRVLDPDEPVAAGLFDREGVRPAVSRTPLWPLLMGWFLAVMLADIATRRIGWDRFISPAIGGWGVPRARGSSVDRGVEAAARAASLRQGRSLKPGSASGRALHEGDVAAVREEQARRRYEAERARLASLRQGIVGATPSGGKAEKTPPKPDEGASGLMAAKRRAQARIREEEDDGSGGGTV